MRSVKTHGGQGQLQSERTAIEVVYVLYEYEDPAIGVPGVRQIEGMVASLRTLPVLGKYVLHLANGRKLKIVLKTEEGRVHALGGFFTGG